MARLEKEEQLEEWIKIFDAQDIYNVYFVHIKECRFFVSDWQKVTTYCSHCVDTSFLKNFNELLLSTF